MTSTGKMTLTGIITMQRLLSVAAPAALLLGAMAAPAEAARLKALGTFETGLFDEGAAEIAAYDGSSRLFVTNANANSIDILDIVDPTNPAKVNTIDLSSFGGGVNSVAFNSLNGFNYIAAAVEASNPQENGSVVFFDTNGSLLNTLTVGALPDMLTFTPDGKTLLVANEGEPSDDYTVDPEGSVSIINVSGDILGLTDGNVKTANFNAFDSQKDDLMAQGVRIFGPGASVSQDLEPEFIAVSGDSTKAYVSLQENNALGILDLTSGEFTDIVSLGFKDHSLPGNALDASDEDGINIQNLPVLGMRQPDAIATYEAGGQTFVVTANEGDARDYDAFSEETDLEDLLEDGLLDLNNDGIADTETTVVDPSTGETVADLLAADKLGEIDFTNATGDMDGDGLIEELHVFGGRSFSIFDEEGNLVFDSGDQFEQIIADLIAQGVLPQEAFNTDNDENDFDSRSDAKGPEPEGITVGEINGRTFAFIGLERIGGVMMYDITNPESPTFLTYVNDRDFLTDFDETNFQEVGDLGPEGLVFISSANSPTGEDLLAVTNEVSGTTTLYSVEVPEPASMAGLLAVGSLGLMGLKRRRQA
ncbi:hypothetical protein XM38_011490 [Halomicronema hongdechloris C2206]|uniref:Choice-of-anchor I domain-containing protein n=2 Tax=Halomicronema hongdechloris TaxID=1209493 RepID=A0A1Z3HIS2_9CYAN|nr:hypothetical protein XM38_011490 [Halomicronema hongdechloris C2206]